MLLEPFPDVYKLFAGDIEPKRILANIAEAEISERERTKREFYAELYIGLHLTVLEEDERALKHLAKAAANKGPSAPSKPVASFMSHR